MKQAAFERAVKAYLKRTELSQAAAARKLHYTSAQFNKWIRGVNRIPDTALQELAELLELTEAERTELFTLAGYVAVTVLQEPPEVNPRDSGYAPPATPQLVLAGDVQQIFRGYLGAFFGDALKEWADSFFGWSKASPQARSSWAGMVIHLLTTVTERITPRGVLAGCIGLLLAIGTVQFVTPILQWPLDDPALRWSACLKYGLATLLIPFLVACVAPPDKPGLFRQQPATFWVLKLAGALVGFWVFSMMSLALALALYYLRLPSLTAVRWVLALVPLFFCYVAARRIPIDRFEMLCGELQLYPADRLFLAVFTFLGPFTAFFLYAYYWFFADRALAPIALISTLAVVALWQYRQQQPEAIADLVLILILGLGIPGAILLYVFFLTPYLAPPSPNEILSLVVALFYILGWSLFIATLLVRGQFTLTLPGVFGLLGVVALTALILAAHRWSGIGFASAVGLVWGLWGRKRFRETLWVHASFWMMLAATGVGVLLLKLSSIPSWSNGLGFMLAALALMKWAYAAAHARAML